MLGVRVENTKLSIAVRAERKKLMICTNHLRKPHGVKTVEKGKGREGYRKHTREWAAPALHLAMRMDLSSNCDKY